MDWAAPISHPSLCALGIQAWAAPISSIYQWSPPSKYSRKIEFSSILYYKTYGHISSRTAAMEMCVEMKEIELVRYYAEDVDTQTLRSFTRIRHTRDSYVHRQHGFSFAAWWCKRYFDTNIKDADPISRGSGHWYLGSGSTTSTLSHAAEMQIAGLFRIHTGSKHTRPEDNISLKTYFT